MSSSVSTPAREATERPLRLVGATEAGGRFRWAPKAGEAGDFVDQLKLFLLYANFVLANWP